MLSVLSKKQTTGEHGQHGDKEKSFRRRLYAHCSTQLFPVLSVFPVVDSYFR